MNSTGCLEKAQGILKQMTDDEKLKLIAGIDTMFTKGVPRLGVRRLRMADASMGLRDGDTPGTAFPAAIALAATWNRKVAADYGVAVGAEFRAAQIDVLLGPGVNIYRVPQCGRNFEYLGEDPILAAAISTAYIKGAQSQGVAATVKHLAGNNMDWHRCVSNSVIDERTLREVYLPAFESAIHEAGVLSVMTGYNLLNGEYAGESEKLVRDLILNEWGFEGVVMSDWCGLWTAEKAFNSGLHLEMPDEKAWKLDKLKELLSQGTITHEELDHKCLAILKWTFAIEQLQAAMPKGQRKCPAHAQVALDVARKGTVLLKNSGALLPLKLNSGHINIVGPCAFPTPTSGGGAAKVDAIDPKSVVGSVMELAPGLDIVRSEKGMDSAEAVIVCVGFNDKIEHEGSDRPFELPWEQEGLIRRCVEANPKTIVVIFAGGAVSMDNWVDRAAAVLHGWYPGENGALAIAEILLGRSNPSGKLPISIERRWQDSPAHKNYIPEGGATYEAPNYIGRHRPVFDVRYEEGVFCGYRHYDKHHIEPLFPFGHGLSYTTFEYSGLALQRDDSGGITVSFTVKNSGSVAGDEIAQVYVGDVEASVPRPYRELKGFESVSLQPGQSTTVKIALSKRAFSFYDVTAKAWRLEPGAFRIQVGASARDIRLEETISL